MEIVSFYKTMVAVLNTILSLCMAVSYVIVSLGYMKCMQKAGEQSWKAWIPFYNDFVMYKIVGLQSFLIIFKIAGAIISTMCIIMQLGLLNQFVSDAGKYIDDSSNYSTYSNYSYSSSYNASSSKARREKDSDISQIIAEYEEKYIATTFMSLINRLLSIGVFVVNILFAIKISKAYGLGGGYIAGMILVPGIFILIIGFGKSEYKGDYVLSNN